MAALFRSHFFPLWESSYYECAKVNSIRYGKGLHMITSASNQQAKNLSALLKKSKERRKQKVFVAEGTRMVQETPRELLQAVYVSEGYAKNPQFEKLCRQFQSCVPDIVYEVMSDSVFQRVSDTQTPQGIMAVVKQPSYQLEELVRGEDTMLLVLDSIQDPGNLGTMIRTGEGAGITGVIMNPSTVDLFNPKTVRSTMGSMYRVPFYISQDLIHILKELKEKNHIEFFAAHLDGTAMYDAFDYRGPCGFLIGNEGNGLSDEVARCANQFIRIPMEGKVESLNAAVAASLLMYESNRQRRQP